MIPFHSEFTFITELLLFFQYPQPGGMKAGTFDPYPSHSQDAYRIKVKRSVNIVNKSGKTFIPSQGPKTRPVISIVDHMVTRWVSARSHGFHFTGACALTYVILPIVTNWSEHLDDFMAIWLDRPETSKTASVLN